MDIKDKDLLNELIIESQEHIANIEPDLLVLERDKDAVSDELINKIFRAIHSIKGGFGFFGLEHIKELSHTMENVLDLVRNRKISVTDSMIEALFKGIDKLKLLLQDVDNSDSTSISEECSLFDPFLTDKPAETKPADKGQETAAVSKKIVGIGSLNQDTVKELVKRGKKVYRLSFKTDSKTTAKRVEEYKLLGEILSITPDPDRWPGGKTKAADVEIYFASILEYELIGAGLGLQESEIEIVDIKAIETSVQSDRKKEIKQAEAVAKAAKSGAAGQTGGTVETSDTLRVRVNLLNNLMNLAGELVLSRNQLLQNVNRKIEDAVDADRIRAIVERAVADAMQRVSAASQRRNIGSGDQIQTLIRKEAQAVSQSLDAVLGIRLGDVKGLNVILQNVDRVTSEMQENIMQTRLQPVSVVFNKFPRVVRDLGRDLKKEVKLEIEGGDVELDKSIIELLSDPLNHIVRNSMDHGLELPDDREEMGKNREGVIKLRAYHESGKVLIEISDDGGGVDVKRVREKAVERSLISRDEVATMGEKEVLLFLFMPGFSTAKQISAVSGRGVGMDVVKTNIEKLGGTVEIDSELGKGTRVIMKLPLTLAIIPSLIVSVAERRFAIPQVGLEELVRIRAVDVASKIETVHGSAVLRLRGKLLPLVRLADVLGMDRVFVDPDSGEKKTDRRERLADRRDPAVQVSQEILDKRKATTDRRYHSGSSVKVVVLKLADNRFGLVVDNVHDNEEIIVKPLSGYLKKCQAYAGSAIMGDGAVAMILDSLGLSTLAGLRFSDIEKESQLEKDRHAKVQLIEQQELLTFRNGTSEIFAVDLSMVARVEKVLVKDIEKIGDKEFLKYDDRSLRLIRMHHHLPIQPPTEEGEEIFVIVPKLVKHPLGIVATNVEDVFHAQVTLDKKNVKGTGILGTAMINKKMIIMVDVYGLFELAEPEYYGVGSLKGIEGKKILLAEDTTFFRTVEENYLKSFGCSVEIARDGEEAWQKLNSGELFDALVTDIEMPSMNGIELVKKIRESGKFGSLPIVMLTALKADRFRERGMEAGADAYELKLDKEQLRKTLLKLVGK
ncbi:MAG: chemotaxis protein CheW [Fibrobacteres bacterium]|nr:chemotaxis protein CheW [Fibrobacterota bacterium]